MSETTPAHLPENADRGDAGALSADEVERLVADFRGWLLDLPANGTADEEASASWDWHEFAKLFVALRHEVHLQTRVVRGQQEQASALLATMQEALAALREAKTQPAPDDRPPAWLKVVLEALDGLDAAHREVARLAQNLAMEATQEGRRSGGWWSRLFGAPRAEPAPGERLASLVESLSAGYAMSRQRLERFLIEHGLEPMACEGRPFDAEAMEVFEVTPAAEHASGTVLAEIRRGYRWRDRPYRCALVRVAK